MWRNTLVASLIIMLLSIIIEINFMVRASDRISWRILFDQREEKHKYFKMKNYEHSFIQYLHSSFYSLNILFSVLI